jgi:hypothetical protein
MTPEEERRYYLLRRLRRIARKFRVVFHYREMDHPPTAEEILEWHRALFLKGSKRKEEHPPTNPEVLE